MIGISKFFIGVFTNICLLQIALDSNRISASAASLIKGLCHVRPEDRFGSSRAGISDVTKHSWFHKLNWNALRKRWEYCKICFSCVYVNQLTAAIFNVFWYRVLNKSVYWNAFLWKT